MAVVNHSTRSSKSARRRARKNRAAARRLARYGPEDRVEYQLTQPLWLIEAMLGGYEPDYLDRLELDERKSA